MSSNSKRRLNVLILAGGYGTRLYPLTLNLPKPLLKIGQRTVIDFSLDRLKGLDYLEEIFVVTNNKFYRNFVQWKKKVKFTNKITVVNDGTKNNNERLGSIGDLYFTIKKEKIDSDILVIAGDNIFKMGLASFMDFANQKLPNISIGVYDVKKKAMATRYGVVKLDKDNRIVDFLEKPEDPPSSMVATCVYFFPKETIPLLYEYVERFKSKTDAAGNYIQWLLKKTKVYAFTFRGPWLDIGQIDTYKKAEREFSKISN